MNPFVVENSKKIPGKRIPGTVKFLACRFQPRKGQAMRLNRGLRYQIKALLDAGHSQKTVSDRIWAETVAMIREDLSPEQVAGRRGLEGKVSPGVPTIYRHIRGVAGHARIAMELEVGHCFARPYHSWERGANENMNGLIRQYLPKGTSFGNLTREQVKRIEWKLNNRPRKRLGFLTPLEYISIQVKQIYLAT